MFLPLGTDRPNHRPTTITYALIAVNIVAFVMQMGTSTDAQSNPLGALSFLLLDRNNLTPWGFIGYAFLHSSGLHIAGNMLFLYVFGPNVEDRFGRVGFLLFYLAGAVAGGLGFILTGGSSVIGASGAVAAVTGAFLVLYPRTHCRVLIIFFFIGVYMIPSWWLIAFAIAKDIFSVGVENGIANTAHLGGYAFGFAVSISLLASGIVKREPYDLFSIMKHKARRRQFSDAARLAEKRKPVLPDPIADEVAERRAEITRQVADGKLDEARVAYLSLLGDHGQTPGAATLSRKHMVTLANYLFERGDHTNAASAYQRILDAYPQDNDSPSVQLMLGLVSARYLNDPVRAKDLIAPILDKLRSNEERKLANQILTDLG